MARLKISKWHHGDYLYRKTVVKVQKTEDGWFAMIVDEPGKMSVLSGPWESEKEASLALIDALDRASTADDLFAACEECLAFFAELEPELFDGRDDLYAKVHAAVEKAKGS